MASRKSLIQTDRDFESIALVHLYLTGTITLTEWIKYKPSDDGTIGEALLAIQGTIQRVLSEIKSLP